MLVSMILSTKSALCCPSQRIWEYSRFSSSLFLREMSLSRCKWKSVNETNKSRPNTDDSGERATYLADLEIRHSVELQGTVEMAQNLGAGLNMRLPDGFLLLLVARNSKGTPDWMIAP